MNYHARILTACAAVFALCGATAQAATVTVNVHPATAAQISNDAALANATVIDLIVDSQGDDLLSFDLTLTTTGTIYNHVLENPNDAAPNPAAVLSFPALGADSHVAFGTPLGGDLSSPSGSFPLSVGGPLPSVTHNGLVARVTVLNDPAATIDGTAFFSADGVTSYDIQYTAALVGDLNTDGFVGIADLNLVLGKWNQNVTPGSKLDGDPSGDGFVGIADLNQVLGNWNAGTPPAANAVPEPATLALLSLTGIATLRRR